MTSPDARHAAWCWFEFVYSMASEIGSPIQITCQEIPINDYHPKYCEIAHQPQSEKWELRFHPEVRRIEHEICQASILALKFLRSKIEAQAAKKPQGKGGQEQKAEQPKEIEYSKPLPMKKWAIILGVSENKMKEIREAGDKYHFDKVSARKWRLPMHEIPTEYLQKYRTK
jgi:hypothetical protein